MQLSDLLLTNAHDPIDCQQRSEAADRRSHRAEHSKLRTIVAIIGIERIADEAAIARLRAKQADLSLKLHRGGGEQRNSKRGAGVAHRQSSSEIVAAVDDEVVITEEFRRVFGVDADLYGLGVDKTVQALHELQGEIGLGIADIALAEDRLSLEVGSSTTS